MWGQIKGDELHWDICKLKEKNRGKRDCDCYTILNYSSIHINAHVYLSNKVALRASVLLSMRRGVSQK